MSNIWKIVMGVIAIAISLIIFPIILDADASILAHASLSSFTGLEAVAKIVPLLVLVAMFFSGGLLAFSGAKGVMSSRKSGRR